MLTQFDKTANSTIDKLSLAIKVMGPSQNHCGIIYRDEDSALQLLHLGWHYRLYNDPPTDEYYWAGISLTSREQKFISALCVKVAKLMPGIPYGFDAKGFRFEPETGVLVYGTAGKGMTCASFILVLLASHGYTLLAEDEWPENANAAWQAKTIELMTEHSVPQDHINAVAKDSKCRRFTPDEVVASSNDLAWPVGFERAQKIAEELRAELVEK